jgi:serine/threonine-protein kinase
MALSVADFWNLFAESQLLAPETIAQYAAAFSAVKGAAHASGATLAEWLIAQNVISRYQASVLLAGKSGPFAYGDYRVYDRIESGRFAGLFRAVHAPTAHPVLLSFLPSAMADDAEYRAHIDRTLAKLGSVSSPYLRRCYDLVDAGRYHFLVCEDLRGGPLAQSILFVQPIPPPEAARLIYEAACGLAAIHTVGLTHGLPQPEQVWLTDAGHVKLLHDPTRLPGSLVPEEPAAGDRPSAADYMAPELFFPDQLPSVGSDIYAVGCIFYQMLAGRPPFAGGTIAEKAARHASEPIVPLDYFGVPPQLAQVVSYMLAKDPRVRFASVPRLLEALTPFINASAIVPPAQPASAAAFEAFVAQRRARQAPPPAAEAASPFEPMAFDLPQPGNFAPPTQQQFGQNLAPPTFPQPAYAAVDSAPLFDELPSPQAAPSRAAAGLLELEPETAPAKPIARPQRGNNQALIGIGIAAVAVLAIAVAALSMLSNRGDGDQIATADKSAPPVESTDTPTNAGDDKSQTEKTSTKETAIDKPDTAKDKAAVIPADTATKDKTTPKSAGGHDSGAATSDGAKPAEPREELIDDDGATLWVSPTAGPPIEAKLIGLGAQAMLVVRPIDLLQSVEGQRFFTALGPAGDVLRAAIETSTGVKFDAIKRIQIAIYPGADGAAPRMTYAVELRDPAVVAELAKNWPGAAAGSFDGKQLYASDKVAYYLPAWGENRWLAVGPIDVIQDAIRQGDHSVTLGSSVDKLLVATDSQRQVTFVAAPQFLFDDAMHFFSGVGERMRQPLADFLGDDVRAVSFSIQISDENSFAEMRVLGTLGRKPGEYANRYFARLGNLADTIENAQVGAKFSPYGEKTLRRFPQMLREVKLNLRAGEEDGQALVRCYLPPRAAHNLAQATDLAIHEAAGSSSASGATSGGNSGPALTGMAAKLAKKITVGFPKEGLDRALEIWANETGVKVVMLGPDMQMEGITKNQQIKDFNSKDQPAEAVLLALLKIANPQGKLVYVLKPESSGGEVVVQITTRAAAAKRKDQLPASLAVDPAATKGPKKPVPRKK